MNLYRIFEIILHDAGDKYSIVASGWATKESMKLFTRTANHPAAVRLDACHGVNTAQPPANPMTLSEACRSLTQSFMHGFAQSLPNPGHRCARATAAKSGIATDLSCHTDFT